MEILDGKKISREILDKIKNDIAFLNFQPVFCDVLVGNDPASIQYVKMKMLMAEKVGIRFYGATFSASINTDDLINEIKIIELINFSWNFSIRLDISGD